MRAARSAMTLLLLIAFLLLVVFSGCIGSDYVANRDIVVVRLDPNRTTAWIRDIDTGYDDSARDMVGTPDGGFLVAGARNSGRNGIPSPRLVRLAPDGTVLWDRTYGNGSIELASVATAGDGDIVAVAYDGKVLRLDPGGTVRWSRDSGLERGIAIITTADGGCMAAGEQMGRIPVGTVVVYNPDGTVSSRPPLGNESVVTPGCTEVSLPAGPDRTVMVTQCTAPYRIIMQGTVVNLDRDGNETWRRSYGAEGLSSVWSVLEDQERGGYLIAGFREEGEDVVNTSTILSAIRTDGNGMPEWVTRIDQVIYYKPPMLRIDSDGYDLMYVSSGYEVFRPAVIRMGLNGTAGTPRAIDAGTAITWTAGGGYFFAAFPLGDGRYGESIYEPASRPRLHAVLLDPDGNRVWDQEIQGVEVNYITKVLQTSDGGFAILAMEENY